LNSWKQKNLRDFIGSGVAAIVICKNKNELVDPKNRMDLDFKALLFRIFCDFIPFLLLNKLSA
jgi:hypothetical protein